MPTPAMAEVGMSSVDGEESEDPACVTGGVVPSAVPFDPDVVDELVAGGRAVTDGGQVKTVPGCTVGSDEEMMVQVGWPVTGSYVMRARLGLLFSANAEGTDIKLAATAHSAARLIADEVVQANRLTECATDFFPQLALRRECFRHPTPGIWRQLH